MFTPPIFETLLLRNAFQKYFKKKNALNSIMFYQKNNSSKWSSDKRMDDKRKMLKNQDYYRPENYERDT